VTASKWAEWPSLCFDIESTGVDPWNDRIVTASLVEIRPGKRPTTTSYLVDPGVEIPAEAEAVHGISTAKAQAEATHTVEEMLFEITGRIALWLGHRQPLVVFNAPYDLTMLEAENRRNSIDTLVDRLGVGKIQPVIDPMVLDKYADKFRKSQPAPTEADPARKICACGCGAENKKLGSLCLHYGVRHTGLHDASGDALAAGRLWPRIIERHPTKFRGMTMPALHQSQISWKKAQQDDLRAYFDKVGKEHDGMPGDWPIQAAPARAAVSS
jgi:DNA polymerase-3 subunit epsilon